ncbi:MAG: hypothetical protein MUE51_01080, partial [Thermoleophilia bacterium]|nr:hypothetical protein [Thermoleophilia bacterium]
MRSRGRWVIASAAALLGAAALALAVPGDRATRLISGGDAVEDAEFGGATADGSRVWFATGAKLLPQDADATWDVYERRPDGSLTLISPGTADLQADFRGATADGTKVWFET